ncbi:MAG: AAA family ATPase [Chloroflexota bacterium]
MDPSIVGRDAEQTVLARALDDLVAGRGSHIVLEGAAGMGKTRLWEDAVEGARRRGVRVLDARPAQVEADLAYAGLHDLVRDLHDADLAAVPAPQRAALDAALYRDAGTAAGPSAGGTGGTALESGAVAIALLSVVRGLADRGPVLVAVDDVQWLDRATLAPARFVVRRVAGRPVATLVTARVSLDGDPEGGAGPDAWTDPSIGMERLQLGPLSIGALHRLLGEAAGLSLPRPALVRLHQLTAGNPFMALELARAWGRDAVARLEAGETLPRTLDGLLTARLGRLEADALRVAQTVAAIGRPPVALLARTVGEGLDLEAALERATAAGVLRQEEDRVRCAHPLIASALLSQLGPTRRRALHALIATSLQDPIEAAPHHAAAAAGPDTAVAAQLDEAARVTARRGAALESLALRERALALTPADDAAEVARRRVALADAAFTVGDTGRAQQLLELPSMADPDLPLDTRLEARLLLATILWFHDTTAALAIAEGVLADAGDDRAWQAKVHARLSWMFDEDMPRQAEHGAAAVALLDPEADPVTYAFAILNMAIARLLAGEGADEAAIVLGERLQERADSWEYSTVPAAFAKAMDRFDEARTRIEAYVERSRAQGDESSMAQLLSMRAEMEAWAGRMDLALDLAETSVALAEQSGQTVYRCISLARRGWIRACLGDLDAAEADARASLALATPPVTPPVPLGVLGFVALTRGDPRAAVGHLLEADAMLAGMRMGDPASYRLHGDLVEALILTGDLDAAERHVTLMEARAARTPRPWIDLVSARGRGLLLAARGDVEGAITAFERALAAGEGAELPLEIARTRLALGVALRRAGRRRLAAAAIETAIDGFTAVGCGPWAQRARGELARVGVRRAPDRVLSPGEERVARMAASGMTNGRIAERLLVSPKTVEATLTRVYGKLGIHTRAELGARMARMPDDTDGGSRTPTA